MSNSIGVYVEFSDLIDTRFNVMELAFPDLAKYIMDNDLWTSRTKEGFSYVSSKLFKRLYEHRNKLSIIKPRPTKIMSLINEVTTRSKHMLEINSEDDESVTIYLNLFPYELSEYETDLIVNSIKQAMVVDVDVVTISSKRINPSWIVQNVNVVLMYNGVKWLNSFSHDDTLEKNTMPEILMITPATEDLLSKGVEFSQEEFDKISEVMAPIMRVEFSDLDLFSCNK